MKTDEDITSSGGSNPSLSANFTYAFSLEKRGDDIVIKRMEPDEGGVPFLTYNIEEERIREEDSMEEKFAKRLRGITEKGKQFVYKNGKLICILE